MRAFAWILLGLIGCSSKADAPAPPPVAPASEAPGNQRMNEQPVTTANKPVPVFAIQVGTFDVDAFEKQRPSIIGQDGVVAAGARFRDAEGDKVLALIWQVEGKSRRLWAYHYLDGEVPKLLSKDEAWEQECGRRNLAQFVEGSVGVTDVDGDGIGEVTFAYDLGCMTSPMVVPRTLFMLEGADRWVLIGRTLSPDGAAGSFWTEPELKAWPDVLIRHASAEWERLLKR